MEYTMEKYLPIGTVVLLKNAKKRLMVVGFAATSKETGDKIYDYIGCLYPEGVISSEQSLVFNHEQIDKVFYMGYSDDENKKVQETLKELISKGILKRENSESLEQSIEPKEQPVNQATPATSSNDLFSNLN